MQTNDLLNQLRRFSDGDPAAAEALAHRACQLALRTASLILQSRDEAGDIGQEVAIDVLRSISKLRDPDAFDAWVHRVTVRHSFRALRRRRVATGIETPLGLIPEPDEPPVVDGIDHDSLLAFRTALAAALSELPPKQRLALALRYVHDLSDEQIAAALGIRTGTTRALLSRGREALRGHPQIADLAPLMEGDSR